MQSRPLHPRWPVSAGALLACVAVALSAYASHAAEGAVRASLFIAAAFAFGHGLGLIALAAVSRGRVAALASSLLLVGVLLFAGALVAKVLFGLSSAVAPWGGTAMMLGWLLHAAVAWRR